MMVTILQDLQKSDPNRKMTAGTGLNCTVELVQISTIQQTQHRAELASGDGNKILHSHRQTTIYLLTTTRS